MARTKNAPATAPTAAHTATDPAPALCAAPADAGPAAAVSAALAANPGSTVAAIADAAGTARPTARAALLDMEKDGTAARAKGARPGIPDTWTPAGPAPEAEPEAGLPAQPGDDPAAIPAAETDDRRDGTPGDVGPAPADGDDAAPETADAEPRDVDAALEGADPAEEADEAEPGVDPDGGDVGDSPAGGEGGSDAGDALDPALLAGLTGRLGQIRAAADAAELTLTAGGDPKAALESLTEIADQAAQARRELKAAIGGRKAPAARPGALREKVLAHLVAHPEAEFTPHEISKVLGHSSGAIANALETLVKLGEAEVANEKPRKFRLAARPADAAPGPHGAGLQETELAGAA